MTADRYIIRACYTDMINMVKSPASILSAVRTARRAQHMFSVLARFGFENLATELGLDRLWGRGLRLLGRKTETEDIAELSQAERVRRVLEQLGPTFIKVGQILSTRPDLIPPDWAKEFTNLQANIPAVPWAKVEPLLREEFPQGLDQVFLHIDHQSIAAASMAQVHRAVLHNGEAVVIKILRPGIRRIIEADMEIMAALAHLMQQHFTNLGYDPVAVVTEFERQLERETDLVLEGQSTDRMQRDFADNPRISFPKVYWEATTSSVLALEEIKGTLLTDLDPTTLSTDQRKRVVQNGADAVFHQCLSVGFFHADPHPGNIFVLSGERICLIDAGMTGTIDPGTAELLADLVHGAIEQDLDRVVRVAVTLTEASTNLSTNRRFRGEVWKFIEGIKVESLAEIQFGRMLEQFFTVLQDFDLQCPADLMHLIKAITTIEGIASDIDPSFDIVGHVRPYLQQLLTRRYGFTAVRKRVQSSVLGYAELAENLPFHVRDFFRAVQQNRISVNIEHRGLEGLTSNVDDASINVSYALLIAAMIIGSSVLLLAASMSNSMPWLSWLAGFGFLTSFGLAMFRIVMSYLRTRR